MVESSIDFPAAGQHEPGPPRDQFDALLALLDRILNDPDQLFDPGRVWSLLDELTCPPFGGRL